MDDTQKMLRAIINGQTTLKQELLGEIKKVDKKVDILNNKLDSSVDGLSKKIDKVDRKLTKRLDNIGRQVAYLEDDAPTREEYDSLVVRVDKLEQQATSAHIPGV